MSKCYCRLGKMDKEEPRLLNSRRLQSQGQWGFGVAMLPMGAFPVLPFLGFFLNSLINFEQGISLVNCVFLCFFQGFSGFGRGQKSWVNLRVFLGETEKSRKGRTGLCFHQLHFGRTVLTKWLLWTHLFHPLFYSVSELRRESRRACWVFKARAFV